MTDEPERKVVPLRWGTNGPVIGTALVGNDGVVSGVISDKQYIDLIKPALPEYSVFNLEDLKEDPQYDYLFQTARFAGEPTKITIKREETDD